MHFQIGWRNIWRNPRRTLVILTAIIIGVWSMIVLSAFMRGMEVGMIQNGISTLTGYIQIHFKGYRNDPVIENSIQDETPLIKHLDTILPTNIRFTSRIRLQAVASNARHVTGITFVGIKPQKEADMSFIKSSLYKGRYLNPEDKNSIIIGQALLDKFETKIGHKLVLMAQDTQGNVISKSFRIVGTFKTELEMTEKQFVFANLKTLKKMLKLSNGISEIAIMLPGNSLNLTLQKQIVSKLREELDTSVYEVHSWQELLPMLGAYLKIFDGFIYIWSFVVFIAMGFGIVNTTLMAVFERMREFGLLKALGMKPLWIVMEVLTESLFLLLLGISIGNGLGFISYYLLKIVGIDLSQFAAGAELWGISRVIYPSIWLQDVLFVNAVVFILGLLVSTYPAIKAARFTPIEALQQT